MPDAGAASLCHADYSLILCHADYSSILQSLHALDHEGAGSCVRSTAIEIGGRKAPFLRKSDAPVERLLECLVLGLGKAQC